MVRDYQVPEQKKYLKSVYSSREISYINKMSLFSNALNACINEIDKAQEKNEKRRRSMEKDVLTKTRQDLERPETTLLETT